MGVFIFGLFAWALFETSWSRLNGDLSRWLHYARPSRYLPSFYLSYWVCIVRCVHSSRDFSQALLDSSTDLVPISIWRPDLGSMRQDPVQIMICSNGFRDRCVSYVPSSSRSRSSVACLGSPILYGLFGCRLVWLPELGSRGHDLVQRAICPDDFITFAPQDPCQVFLLVSPISYRKWMFTLLVILVKFRLTLWSYSVIVFGGPNLVRGAMISR